MKDIIRYIKNPEIENTPLKYTTDPYKGKSIPYMEDLSNYLEQACYLNLEGEVISKGPYLEKNEPQISVEFSLRQLKEKKDSEDVLEPIFDLLEVFFEKKNPLWETYHYTMEGRGELEDKKYLFLTQEKVGKRKLFKTIAEKFIPLSENLSNESESSCFSELLMSESTHS